LPPREPHRLPGARRPVPTRKAPLTLPLTPAHRRELFGAELLAALDLQRRGGLVRPHHLPALPLRAGRGGLRAGAPLIPRAVPLVLGGARVERLAAVHAHHLLDRDVGARALDDLAGRGRLERRARRRLGEAGLDLFRLALLASAPPGLEPSFLRL